MHVEEISACALPLTGACSAGHTASPEIRFLFSLCPLHGCCAGAAAGPSWAWSEWKSHPGVLLVLDCWKERGLAPGAVSSAHGQLSCPGARWMKVNINNKGLGLVGHLRACWCWIRLEEMGNGGG